MKIITLAAGLACTRLTLPVGMPNFFYSAGIPLNLALFSNPLECLLVFPANATFSFLYSFFLCQALPIAVGDLKGIY